MWWDDPPPDAASFDALCAKSGGRVRAGESATTGGGRALFATAPVAKGEIVFRESPSLILQDPANRPLARACARCHSMLRGAPNETVCAQGCGEGYCDERCRVAHVEQGSHGLLCVGPIDSWEHPLAALKLACARDDDGDGHLALIAEMCARCIASAARRGDASSSSSSSGASTAVAAALDDASLRTYVAGAVWDWTGASGGDGARARCEAHARMIREAMASHEGGSEKLRGAEALMDPASGVVGARGVAELAGVLARNSLAVAVESSASASAPSSAPASAPASAPSSAPGDASTSNASPPHSGARYEGVALFPLTCLMNHSCEPNAEVRFEDAGPGTGVVAAVHALREIRVGEELRHSYVDETRPVFLRAADLAAFGFRCDCGRCARARGGS